MPSLWAQLFEVVAEKVLVVMVVVMVVMEKVHLFSLYSPQPMAPLWLWYQ